MLTIDMLRRAQDDATALIALVGPADRGRATPCTGWDLDALLAHMIGQNHGFADAVDAGPGEVGLGAFAPRPVGSEPAADWRASAHRLVSSFTRAPVDATVLLAEIAADQRLPLELVVEIQLIDTVVHTWDVATALGRTHHPDDDLVHLTLARVAQIPDGPERSTPGAAFAPVVPPADPGDPWSRTLALLGRTGPE